jgi:phosphoribosylglycinamide formyltransferase-1
MIKIQIWASGGGSNAEKIISYFETNERIQVDSIITDQRDAGVIDLVRKWGIDCWVKAEKEQRRSDVLLPQLQESGIDFIVLAGYLKKIPETVIASYPNKIINIHPSLLPRYGGKGMYGLNVHKAVAAAKEGRSGMSIHVVTEQYDEGPMLAQYWIDISDLGQDAKRIQARILKLEHYFFPRVIEKFILSANQTPH